MEWPKEEAEQYFMLKRRGNQHALQITTPVAFFFPQSVVTDQRQKRQSVPDLFIVLNRTVDIICGTIQTVEIALQKHLWRVGHVMISVIHGPKSGMVPYFIFTLLCFSFSLSWKVVLSDFGFDSDSLCLDYLFVYKIKVRKNER